MFSDVVFPKRFKLEYFKAKVKKHVLGKRVFLDRYFYNGRSKCTPTTKC